MTEIALLRHFPTRWNLERRFQGQSDIPLTDESRQQLRQLAIPRPWDTARIIASPLTRADETARILARGRRVSPEPRLVEIGFGDWEGRHGADLLADPESGYVNIEDWGWRRRAPGPGGESPRDVWLRVQPMLAGIAADPTPALLVTHRALIRVILARAWGWNFDRPEPFRIRRAHLHPVTLDHSGAPVAASPLVALVPLDGAG